MQNNSFQAPRYSTKRKSDFGPTVKKRVNEYFKSNNISKTGDYRIWIKAILLISLYIVPFVFLLNYGASLNLITFYGLWLMMGVGIAGMGLGIMHDACHGSMFKSKKLNDFIGQFTLNFIAGSTINWKIQHNVLHHSFTNVDGYDEDISPPGVMRFSPNQERKPFFKYQAYYAWFFYGLMTFMWATFKDFAQMPRFHKMGLLKQLGKSYRREWIALIVRKVFYYAIFLALPIYLIDLPWYHVALGWFAMHFVAGLILGVIFQCAHVIPTTSYPAMDENHQLENDVATHQMLTTANFANDNRLLSWYAGGLNFQIEHHLFPNICHIHHKDISKIVRQTAEEFGLPYQYTPSFVKAVGGHAKFLDTLGKKDF